MTVLDLTTDPVELTTTLVDIPSPSHEEGPIADAVESALRRLADTDGRVEVLRHGNTVLARTHRGLPGRVILAGHLDTVPITGNVPHTRGPDAAGEDTLFGCGTVDMKSGLAVILHTFASLHSAPDLGRDLTVIAYEGEEVSSEFNGLGHVEEHHPEWLAGDLAVLAEPSGAVVEAGCQGSIRVRVTAHGVRAHSARSWLGRNAAHLLAPVLARIVGHESREVDIDGCLYREGLNVVGMRAGVATNTIPDEASLTVNFRFAPDRDPDSALAYMLEVLDLEDGLTHEVEDSLPAALPGLSQPAAAELVRAVGGVARAKFGWTDVARFAARGTPAVNFGPGDPGFAHKRDEQCPIRHITAVADQLRDFLTAR